jgi:hypothetical protein
MGLHSLTLLTQPRCMLLLLLLLLLLCVLLQLLFLELQLLQRVVRLLEGTESIRQQRVRGARWLELGEQRRALSLLSDVVHPA